MLSFRMALNLLDALRAKTCLIERQLLLIFIEITHTVVTVLCGENAGF